MSNLADLERAKQNAAKILGKSEKRWQIFEKINGKRSGADIAKETGVKQPNVVNDLTYLENQGLIRDTKKSTKATIYEKVPELRNINLRSYLKGKRNSNAIEKHEVTESEEKDSIIYSQAINKVIEIGKKHGIENIDQNWIDALAILNFIETSATKFLMEHGYTDDQVKALKWEQKINGVEAKLFEEAKGKGVTLRTTVLTFFKNYRVLRNDIDHHAHLISAKITKPEVNGLLRDLSKFVQIVFDEHKKYCANNQQSP